VEKGNKGFSTAKREQDLSQQKKGGKERGEDGNQQLGTRAEKVDSRTAKKDDMKGIDASQREISDRNSKRKSHTETGSAALIQD